MSGWLSTHVLDTARGIPAAGMKITLWRMNSSISTASDNTASDNIENRQKNQKNYPYNFSYIKATVTNSNGRTESPLLEKEDFQVGFYELVFSVGDYFGKTDYFSKTGCRSKADTALSKDHPFLSAVPICFGISDPNAHYHVPLLVSPWSYSTYRGS